MSSLFDVGDHIRTVIRDLQCDMGYFFCIFLPHIDIEIGAIVIKEIKISNSNKFVSIFQWFSQMIIDIFKALIGSYIFLILNNRVMPGIYSFLLDELFHYIIDSSESNLLQHIFFVIMTYFSNNIWFSIKIIIVVHFSWFQFNA